MVDYTDGALQQILFIQLYFIMTFDKKTIITIVASVAGVIVLWGIIGFATHARQYNDGFRGNFQNVRNVRNVGNMGCNNFAQWKQADMMSGIDNIVETKDYATFQTLFSGSRMLEQIDTPEKFATWVELHTSMENAQELRTELWLDNTEWFGPMMMFGDKGGNNCEQMRKWDIKRGNIKKWGMMRR